LIAATAPIVGLLLVFSRELLLLWVGPDFAAQSTAVAKWLAFGVFVNVAAQAPITMVQAANRPDLIAKLQLAQLPFFIGFAWYMVQQFGSVGAAMAWACRACLEAVLARKIAKSLTAAPAADRRQLKLVLLVALFLSGCWAIDSLWRYETMAKLVLFLPVLLLFVAWLWRRLLTVSERRYLLDRLRLRPHGG
jgi:O-antigen/teichoic acid export membrane protein